MAANPRIQLSLTSLDRSLERLAIVVLIMMWGLAVYMLLTVPRTIPVHFNFSGEPDRYGSKALILVLPIFGAGQFFLLTWLNKYPHIFNYPVKITEENAEKQYSIATRMLRVVKLSVLLMFTLILFLTYLTIIGYVDGLGTWFVPVVMGVFLIPIIIAVAKAFKVNKIG